MVKITEELIRKRSEHNEGIIGTLEELSLHQEDIEKIEHIHNWCKELQILYLQSNLISKIENLHKLKKLQYLNLAINNVEKIENLERCESLEKLDLTLNFIGDLSSVCSLKNNIHLKELYLTGNPCTDYDSYRIYVIGNLTQLKSLDNVEITKSDQIKAQQILDKIAPKIHTAQLKYNKFREEQKRRFKDVDNDCVDDETFWKSKSEHSPEMRVEISKRSRLARGKDSKSDEEKVATKSVAVFTAEGRPLNINQAKVNFKYDDSDPAVLILDVALYKHLDTSYVDVDLQPIYVRITIKGKIFQFVFPEEIYTDKSTAKRSQITGHLVLTMPRVNYKATKTNDTNYLEVTGKDVSLDFSKIVEQRHPEVPPLEFA